VPMAMGAALKLKQVVTNVERILAIEFLCAAQGIDYLRPLKSSASIEATHSHIRKNIPHVALDRVLSTDIERMIRIMNEPDFIRLAEDPS
jgi:histidine ammonia-lyase